MRTPNKSRSRNKNQNRRSTTNIVNRVFDSSGPEGKVRGTPQQIVEKYQMLARDAQLAGDRVAAENFQQHSEHYTRLLSDAMREQARQREAQEAQRREQQQQHQQRNEQRQQPAQNLDPQQAEQPEIIDTAPLAGDATQGDSGLVETPENTPKPRRRRPAPKKAAPESPKPNQSQADDQPAPTSGEQAPQ